MGVNFAVQIIHYFYLIQVIEYSLSAQLVRQQTLLGEEDSPFGDKKAFRVEKKKPFW